MKPKLPTAQEMKDFAERFTKYEWRRLCDNQRFLDLVCYDLPATRILAEQILAGKLIIHVT
jgi:hypothetical protein